MDGRSHARIADLERVTRLGHVARPGCIEGPARIARRILLLVALAVLLGVSTASCGQETARSTDGAYTLRFSHHIPAAAPPARALEEWAQKVEEATDGQVQFIIYPAETLAKGRDALRAVEDGVCDVANINFAYVDDRWSLNSVISLGSVAMPSGSAK